MAKQISKDLAALFKEWEEDYAAAKREDAHARSAPTEKEAFRKLLNDRTEAQAEPEKGKDRGIER